MSDISDKSAEWWDKIMHVAESTYQQWQVAPPLSKSQIQCVPTPDLSNPRFARLESRALSMLLESVPESIKQDMVVTRNLSCVNAIYRILITYQPGGLDERQRLIKGLAEPGQATTAKEAADLLRKWRRWLARFQGLGVSTPDAAILLGGIDKLASGIIQAHPQLSFRCSVARTQAQLDFNPTLDSVVAYAKHLQAEFEVLAVSGLEEPTNPKKPKLQRMEGENGRDKGKGKQEGKGSKGDTNGAGNGADSGKTGKDNAKGGGKPCGFYLTTKGCSKGRNCTFKHDFGKAKGEGRCFSCGSSEHRQQACTRPQGFGTTGGKDNGGKQKGEGKAKSNEQASASAAGQQDGSSSNSNAARNTSQHPAASGGVPKTPGGVSSGNSENAGNVTIAGAQAQVLEEAQKLLKSLRIAAMRVPEVRGESPERVHEPHSNPEEERPPRVDESVESMPEVFVFSGTEAISGSYRFARWRSNSSAETGYESGVATSHSNAGCPCGRYAGLEDESAGNGPNSGISVANLPTWSDC